MELYVIFTLVFPLFICLCIDGYNYWKYDSDGFMCTAVWVVALLLFMFNYAVFVAIIQLIKYIF
jgi:hypothetical protein